jgi:hypothetical protein
VGRAARRTRPLAWRALCRRAADVHPFDAEDGPVHELSIAESVVEGVRERTGDARIARVFLQVGRWSCVEPDAIRFCFDLCARGTAVEGAALEIEEIAGDGLLVKAVELA